MWENVNEGGKKMAVVRLFNPFSVNSLQPVFVENESLKSKIKL